MSPLLLSCTVYSLSCYHQALRSLFAISHLHMILLAINTTFWFDHLSWERHWYLLVPKIKGGKVKSWRQPAFSEFERSNRKHGAPINHGLQRVSRQLGQGSRTKSILRAEAEVTWKFHIYRNIWVWQELFSSIIQRLSPFVLADDAFTLDARWHCYPWVVPDVSSVQHFDWLSKWSTSVVWGGLGYFSFVLYYVC